MEEFPSLPFEATIEIIGVNPYVFVPEPLAPGSTWCAHPSGFTRPKDPTTFHLVRPSFGFYPT
ncbi:MAG: hypothetical protein KGS48_08740 [Bacteroidetes bacterium]|nr:hypothetical protein [Bacteroidota bacterium]